jgi:hypothetical protein
MPIGLFVLISVLVFVVWFVIARQFGGSVSKFMAWLVKPFTGEEDKKANVVVYDKKEGNEGK